MAPLTKSRKNFPPRKNGRHGVVNMLQFKSKEKTVVSDGIKLVRTAYFLKGSAESVHQGRRPLLGALFPKGKILCELCP